MAEDRLKVWETLFQRALVLIDSVAKSMTGDYVEASNSLKLIFPEGEIDFIASAPLTSNHVTLERLFDRDIRVETSTEIIAKKVWHRGQHFKARDMFDLAVVAEREPNALNEIRPVLRDRRGTMLSRMAQSDKQLRSDFAELEVLDYRPSYDDCARIVKQVLKSS